MEKEKSPYIPPRMEVVMFECDDIITTSNYVSDENVDTDW